jgi:hypothetical protein
MCRLVCSKVSGSRLCVLKWKFSKFLQVPKVQAAGDVSECFQVLLCSLKGVLNIVY